jgi:dipeptidyl aminopeptidase/acylaminoacyl peptidase
MKNSVFLFLLILIASCSPEKTPEVTKYSIEQFYKNTRFEGANFSPDETKLLISSDETGIYNVFEINLANRSRKQLTNSATESCFAVDYVYGTGEIIYTADKGGDENSHLYLLKTDGTVKDLTPGDAVKASFTGWSRDKRTMYLASNKRDRRYFDLYLLSTGDWKEEMIYKNTDGYELYGGTKDMDLIALVKSNTTSTSQLYIHERKTGKMTEISEPGKPGNYFASGFSSDNSYLYYTTNAGSEFSYLVRYEIATGKRETIYQANWDVSGSYLSENGKYLAILINDDARNVLKLYEAASGKEIKYPMIRGANILDLNIADSEQKIMLTIGTSKTTGDIYECNIGDTTLRKLTNAMNPEINPDDLIEAEIVRYRSFDSLEIPAIFYKPLTATRKNKVPALVMVHGGPGGQSRVSYSPLIQYLGNHGYAILAVNNRGSSGYGKTFFKMDDRNHGDKDLKDCIYGKKWLQSLDFIDDGKIGIIGGSYGGFMTMAAMTFAPDEFRVGVNFFGVTNWLRTLKSIPPYWASFREALYSEMGDPYTADSVRLYNISPLFHAKNIRNPIMVLQGKNDPRVLQVESDEIVAAAKANNVPVEYVVFPDEGHGFRKKENEIKANGQILLFLEKYLRGEDSQK